uniref:Putative secreted protein n=1 Tax=Ixodes ricinus TaxID=34613 RepID=A0A6B0UH49_IXORI
MASTRVWELRLMNMFVLSSPLGVLSSLTPSRNCMQQTNKQHRLSEIVSVLMATATWYSARCSSGLLALLGPALATRCKKNSARKAMRRDSRHSSARDPSS